jgi:hypothetical protein
MALDALTPESSSWAEAIQPTLATISQPELGKRPSAPSRAPAAQATTAPQTGQACHTGIHASSNAHPGPPEHNHGRGTIGPSLPTSDNCIGHPAAGECIPSAQPLIPSTTPNAPASGVAIHDASAPTVPVGTLTAGRADGPKGKDGAGKGGMMDILPRWANISRNDQGRILGGEKSECE